MIPEPVELDHTMSGKDECICENGADKIVCEEGSGRHGNVGVVRVCPSSNESGMEGNVHVVSAERSSRVHCKRASAHRELTMEDLRNNLDDMEDDEDDSDWEPVLERNGRGGNLTAESVAGNSRVVCEKASVHRELTMKDLCNYADNVEDDEDDSDWEPVLEHNDRQGNVPIVSLEGSSLVDCKKTSFDRELTMGDLCNNRDVLEDEEDDSDWEPVVERLVIKRWFCTNCTMFNLDGMIFCESCNEHKESGIVKHGFFASPISQEADLTEDELKVIEQYTSVAYFIPQTRYLRRLFQFLVGKSNGYRELERKKGCMELERLKSSLNYDRGDGGVLERLSLLESLSDVSAATCSTVVGFDERMLLHSEAVMKSHPHPERPDRLRAIAASLSEAGIFPGKCRPVVAREITRGELRKVHSMENIEAVELTRQMISSYFTPDTYANEHSAQAARLAAGLCADLATEIYSGRAKNGFALVRPPGHHAGVHQSMGFCLHNNAAIAALAAQVAGAKKILILDWDVHHGNGTQEIFERNKSVLYISLHRHEGGSFYPGTGAAHEVGTMGAEGFCVNVPWSRGRIGDNDYIFAFRHIVFPIAWEFAPDFIVISAGFDAARGDPLGGCDVTPAGYAWMTEMLTTLASGKLLAILEGGYNLRSISSSATAVIKVLLGEGLENQFDSAAPSVSGMKTMLEVLKIQTNFWPSLNSNLKELQACWESYLAGKKRKEKIRKPQFRVSPVWWMLGRRWFLHYIHSRRCPMKP